MQEDTIDRETTQRLHNEVLDHLWVLGHAKSMHQLRNIRAVVNLYIPKTKNVPSHLYVATQAILALSVAGDTVAIARLKALCEEHLP